MRPVLFGGAIATERHPVAVITFENQTGDPQYDNLKKVIPNLLITSLEQSKYLQVVTWERLRDLVKQAGKQGVEDIDADLGFEICRREKIEAIVIGSFTKLGDRFVTDIKVLDVDSKGSLAVAKADGRGLESIPGAGGRAEPADLPRRRPLRAEDRGNAASRHRRDHVLDRGLHLLPQREGRAREALLRGGDPGLREGRRDRFDVRHRLPLPRKDP